MKESLERVDSAALFFASGRQELALAQASANQKRFEAELRVEESNITEPGEREAAKAVRDLWDDYRKKLDEFLEQKEAAGQVDYYFRVLQPEFTKIKDAADRVLDLNQDAMVHKSDVAQRISRNAATTMVITALSRPSPSACCLRRSSPTGSSARCRCSARQSTGWRRGNFASRPAWTRQ